MKNSSIQQFINLRRQLTEERNNIQARLDEINEALGEMTQPISSGVQVAAQSTNAAPKRGRRAAGPAGQSLREHVLAVLDNGAMTKEEVLAAVQARGYQFSTNNPLNSLGVILYGKNPQFNRAGGKFSLGNGATTSSKGSTAGPKRAGKSQMSPEARA